MYTVFRGHEPKRNRLGLVVFVRTLADARAQTEVGERVVRWNKYGHPAGVWSRHPDGRFRKVG